MPLLPETKSFLAYLQQRKDVRDRIKASRDKTLLYAGDMFGPAWREVQVFQRKQPGTVEILLDVLAKLLAPSPHLGTLQSNAEALAQKEKVANGARGERVVWRTLSGIFASNAEGKVWFYVGSNVSPDTKVFALTEVAVLKRNPRISPESQGHACVFRALCAKQESRDERWISAQRAFTLASWEEPPITLRCRISSGRRKSAERGGRKMVLKSIKDCANEIFCLP